MTIAVIFGFLIVSFLGRRGDRNTGEAQTLVPRLPETSSEVTPEDHRAKLLEARRKGRDAQQQCRPALPTAHSDVLEELSDAVFRKRIIEIFANAYLTLMAIIQGGVFGIVFISVQPDLAHKPASLQGAITLSQAFAVGLTVIIVTHQYIMLTVIARWVPTVSDTFIPYLLGFGEIWMALAVGHDTSWWMALSSMSLIAAFAFWYTKVRTVEGMFVGKQMVYQLHCRSIVRQIRACMIMLIVSAITAALNAYQACPAQVNIGLTWAVIGLGLAILTQGGNDQNRAYDGYGIPRWRNRNDHGGHY